VWLGVLLMLDTDRGPVYQFNAGGASMSPSTAPATAPATQGIAFSG
jgi:hypothetical protein